MSGQPDVITGLQLQCKYSSSPQGAEYNGIAYICKINHLFCAFLIKVPSQMSPAMSSVILCVRIRSGSGSQSSVLEEFQPFISYGLLALITPFGKGKVSLDQPSLL